MSIHSMEELMRTAKHIGAEETRRESEDYLEMVVDLGKLGAIETAFRHYFGVAFKPAGVRPCETCDKVSEPYGGITTDQTLYFTAKDELSNAAMIWPWTDGRRATIKIIQDCL